MRSPIFDPRRPARVFAAALAVATLAVPAAPAMVRDAGPAQTLSDGHLQDADRLAKRSKISAV